MMKPGTPSRTTILLVLGALLVIAPSLYVGLATRETASVEENIAFILQPGSSIQALVSVPYDGRLRVEVRSQEEAAPIAVVVRGPGGEVLAQETLLGGGIVDVDVAGSSEPYRVLLYYPEATGAPVSGVAVVVASYKEPVYASPAACNYTLPVLVGGILLGLGLSTHIGLRASNEREGGETR